ncbi:SpoIIE family protein phosphatase [Hugenholtzia roseola]|uniref:SpoIIE family protein phosphatase n=1 Tax=Hugenholtzia roseola TaxID=1002 RepID=UPI000405C023|nr:SpoIIE family protein phosphatase [Hugenholtzia roseola]
MIKYFFLCTLFLLMMPLSAQQYLFKEYGLGHGLPQSELPSPQAICVDSQGRIWVVTNGGGMAILEQEKYRLFKEKDGLNSNLLMGLIESPEKELWILSQNKSISRYDGHNFYSYPELEGKLRLGGTLACDKRGNVWVLVFGGGVGINQTLYWKPRQSQTFVPFEQADSLTAPSPTLGLTHTLDYDPILSQNGKLYAFDGKVFVEKKYPSDSLLVGKNLFFNYKDFEGNEWLTAIDPNTGNAHLLFFEVRKKRFTKIEVPQPFIWGLGWQVRYFTNKKLYLVNPNLNQILIYQNKKFVKSYGFANGLQGALTGCGAVVEDSVGSVWVGTRGAGLIKLPNDYFSNFTQQDGLQGNMTFGIYEDSKKRVWLGSSAAGITLYEGGRLKTVLASNQQAAVGRVSHFFEKGDTIFAATGGGIISIIESEKDKFSWQFSHQRFHIPAGYYRTIRRIDDIVWFCSQANGVFGYDIVADSLLYQFNLNEVGSSTILDVKKDKKGNYWFATFNGLSKWDGKKFELFNTKQGLKNNFILQIHIDRKDHIWAVAYNGGLARFDGKNFTTYQSGEGLSSDIIYSILPVSKVQNQYWIGTQRGLDKATFDDRGNLVKVEYFNKELGYLGEESNGKAIMEDSEGGIWVGHLTGVTRCDFGSAVAPKAHKTFITAVNLSLNQTNWRDSTYQKWYESLTTWENLPQKLRLPAEENSLVIRFYTTDFSNPKGATYQWQLEGLHSDFQPPTYRSEANFSNLPAGTYTFKVRSRVQENQAWSQTATFEFEVLPKWWQKIEVQIIGFLFSTLMIFGLIKWRTKSLEASKIALEKLVKERTQEVVRQKDEILEKNKTLEVQQEKLSQAYDEIQEKNQNITASITYAKRIQEAMLPSQERIWRILPQSFVFYQPRDIVSGDFYWLSEIDHQIIIAAVDCTGHGVPGAFMSVIGSNILYEVIESQRILEPAAILYALHENVRRHLNQDQTHNRDGMDIALCIIDKNERLLHFAGAKNPLLHVRQGSFELIKGSKYPIGGIGSSQNPIFTQKSIPIAEDSTFYIYSDGFQDQFGGKEGRKYMSQRFQALLVSLSKRPLQAQKEALAEELTLWQQAGKEEQVDDILVIGFKF